MSLLSLFFCHCCCGQQRERHSEPGRPVSLCGTLTSAGSLRRCSSSSGGCYLDASGTSVLNQRLTAASTLSTRATPTSRAALLTRKPDASNINLRERGEKRKTTVRSLLLLLLACLLSIYLCIYYYVITCMLCIYLFFICFVLDKSVFIQGPLREWLSFYCANVCTLLQHERGQINGPIRDSLGCKNFPHHEVPPQDRRRTHRGQDL